MEMLFLLADNEFWKKNILEWGRGEWAAFERGRNAGGFGAMFARAGLRFSRKIPSKSLIT